MSDQVEALAEGLFGKAEEAPAQPQAEAPAEPVSQPLEQQEAATPTVEPEPQPSPEPKQEPKTVPLATFLDQRDELKELRRFRQEHEAKQQAPKAPDPIDDPDGYTAHHEQRFEQRLTAQRFEMSDIMARQAHGDEAVEKATEWALERAQKDQAFASQYMSERNPIDWMVRQHKRDAVVSQLPTDISSLDELIEREVAKRLQPAPQPAPAGGTQPVTVPPAAPTKSLVGEPSGGGIASIPVGPLAGIDTVFPR